MEYDTFTVVQLKALLSKRGLPKSGDKSALIDRLRLSDGKNTPKNELSPYDMFEGELERSEHIIVDWINELWNITVDSLKSQVTLDLPERLQVDDGVNPDPVNAMYSEDIGLYGMDEYQDSANGPIFVRLRTPNDEVIKLNYVFKNYLDELETIRGISLLSQNPEQIYVVAPMGGMKAYDNKDSTIIGMTRFVIPITIDYDATITTVLNEINEIVGAIKSNFPEYNLIGDKYLVELINVKVSGIAPEDIEQWFIGNLDLYRSLGAIVVELEIRYIDEKSLRPGGEVEKEAHKRFKKEYKM
jgi:hypothetical protein